METVNCIRCGFRHKDNGNCTAVGGFCTAVPAAHCLMLRMYLDTGLEPEQCVTAKTLIYAAFSDDPSKADRIRELLKADKEGRLVVLPCKVGDTVYTLLRTFDGADVVGETELWWTDIPQLGKTVFLTREEAEKELEATKMVEYIEHGAAMRERKEAMQEGGSTKW